MFGNQLTKLFDFLGDQWLKVNDIASAEEWAQSLTACSMQVMAHCSAYPARHSQAPELVVVLVSA